METANSLKWAHKRVEKKIALEVKMEKKIALEVKMEKKAANKGQSKEVQ